METEEKLTVVEEEDTLEGPEERRRHDRSRLIVDVFVDGIDATGVASTKDISVGGFYLNTKATFTEGTVVLVRIPFANAKQIIANAKVIHNDPGQGVGLRFLDLSEENRTLIESEIGRG